MRNGFSAASLQNHNAAHNGLGHGRARRSVVARPNQSDKFDLISQNFANKPLALLSVLNTEMSTSDSRTILRIVRDIARALPALLHRIEPDIRDNSQPFLSKGYEQLRLTRRQRQVLDLLLNGSSNKEIARSLSLAEGTVKVHVGALFRTLGVSNRTSAAIAGTRLLGGLNQDL
jgi:ATP/maltotriose-dependent transcriptional regulator MalT